MGGNQSMVDGRSWLTTPCSCFEGGPVCIYKQSSIFVLYFIHESRMIIDGRSWFRHKIWPVVENEPDHYKIRSVIGNELDHHKIRLVVENQPDHHKMRSVIENEQSSVD
jgi:hypothetical protein